MAYPTMLEYQAALQNPGYCLEDGELKRGSVETSGMGLPLARSGGFALTYKVTVDGKYYALRCFHRQMSAIEERYDHIARELRRIHSPQFVTFRFLPAGIRIENAKYPIVAMEWIEGQTLGLFLGGNYRDAAAIRLLRDGFRSLAASLEAKNIAHGDIQCGNIMVPDVQTLRLIDYDGMWVPGMRMGGGTELGHPHFQHPRRSADDFGPHADRFSFIALDLSLDALRAIPELYPRFSEGGETVIFKAKDLRDPHTSEVFRILWGDSNLRKPAEQLAELCLRPVADAPSLREFVGGNWGTATWVGPLPVTTPPPIPTGYIGAYHVLDAADYTAAIAQVGNKVELVGRIVEVKRGVAITGQPYVFVNFGHWRPRCVRLTIWSDGLRTFDAEPDAGWIGKWVSALGLVEPPYGRRSYENVGIVVTHQSQVVFLTEQEALHRLTGSALPLTAPTNDVAVQAPWPVPTLAPVLAPLSPQPSQNRRIVDQIAALRAAGVPMPVVPPPVSPKTAQTVQQPAALQTTGVPPPPVSPKTAQTVQRPTAPTTLATKTVLTSAPQNERRWVLWIAAIVAAVTVIGVSATAVMLARPSKSSVVTGLMVYDDVFNRQTGEFGVGNSVAACFSVQSHGAKGPFSIVVSSRVPFVRVRGVSFLGASKSLDVVVSSGPLSPTGRRDPRVIARANLVSPTSAPPCVAVRFLSSQVLPGRYYVWVLEGTHVLAQTTFLTSGTAR